MADVGWRIWDGGCGMMDLEFGFWDLKLGILDCAPGSRASYFLTRASTK